VGFVLAIYTTLFDEFARRSVRYTAFKSLEHLQDDLAGERGDIDVWVHGEDVDAVIESALTAGFFTVRWSSTKGIAFILIGWDLASGKKVLLHVHRRPIAVKKRSFLPLYFVYQREPSEVKKTRSKIPLQATDAWCDRFEQERSELKSLPTAKLLRMVLARDPKIGQLGFRFSFTETARIYVTYLRRFLFLRGRYRIARRGMLIAFTGVDGSGKSSVVDDLSSSSFLKSSQGVRVSYFGNKGFWIPGLGKAVLRHQRATPVGVVVMGLSLLDRKLRIVPALIAKARGRVVLCDRFYYDQNIFDPTENYFRNRALKAVVNPIVSWIPVLPRRTFYLRVPAKVAFARKQDYAFEKVERITDAYDKLLIGRPEVAVIDATQPLEKVLTDVRTEITAQLRSLRYRR
jgi:thymidylate kinase